MSKNFSISRTVKKTAENRKTVRGGGGGGDGKGNDEKMMFNDKTENKTNYKQEQSCVTECGRNDG